MSGIAIWAIGALLTYITIIGPLSDPAGFKNKHAPPPSLLSQLGAVIVWPIAIVAVAVMFAELTKREIGR